MTRPWTEQEKAIVAQLPTTEEMYRDYQGGMSIQGIADKCGCAFATIQKRFRRAGLKTRSLSEAHRLAYETGRREGKGPTGPDHWAWKEGKERRQYRDKVQKERCDLCRSQQNLVIHHRDFDHYNNELGNLQVLCVSRHQRLHKQTYWDAIKAGKEPPKSNGPVGWERA